MFKKQKKKRTSRNLKISTRITFATVLAIIIPVAVVVTFTSIFLNSMTSYFNFSSVTTNSYSMLNQIQWSQTMSSISNELISEDEYKVKYKKVGDFVAPLETLGVSIYIESGGSLFYSSADKTTILNTANEILPINTEQNTNYFGENGMVIVTHAESKQESYLVIIAGKDYRVEDVSSRSAAQNYSSLVFSKTGLIILLIILVFILSTLALSFITSSAINQPLKKLTDGANEIANGNLDFVIDYDSTNEIGQTVKSFNDMTKRLKASIEDQNRIEQSRKEMIAGVAHDLRTPLTSVKGYVEGLRDGIANTPEKQDRYLKTIYSSTLSMERMLDDLLTISRLELGNIELDKKTVNLNDFLDDCAADIGFELEKRNFDFVYENNCQNPTYTKLDEARFERVIRNIVSNSIKYAKKEVKGKIVLEAQDYIKSVIISIADNGIGLDSGSLPMIFETFYRADKARTNVSEGSGIGLAVCKQIVELHGGHIWATGTEGEGLTILISLEKTEVTEETDSNE